MQFYTENCRKMCVGHGIGDCLRALLLVFKMPSYYKHTGGITYISYEFINHNKPHEWETNNLFVIRDFLSDVSGAQFVTWEEYMSLPIRSLYPQETSHFELSPFFLKSKDLPTLPDNDKKNIAIQTRGGFYDASPKQFNHNTVYEVVKVLTDAECNVHIIDRAQGNYISELKNLLNGYNNVYFYNNSFLQNYALVSLCDALIAPDSWTKYVLNAAGQDLNKIIVCTHLNYVNSKEELLKTYFKQLINPRTRILGYSDNGEAIPNVASLSVCDMLCELSSMLANI